MKRISILLSALVLAVAACTKSSTESVSISSENSLTGKWAFIQFYNGIGDGRELWQPAQPAEQTIEFKNDGTFQATVAHFSHFTRYEIVDSASVNLRAGSDPAVRKMAYLIDADGALRLSPLDPVCICGCAEKFKRTVSK